jgi:hypothetical protein
MARSVQLIAASLPSERDGKKQKSSKRFTPLRPRQARLLAVRRRRAEQGAFSPIQLPPRARA